jgi:hypothetical protein
MAAKRIISGWREKISSKSAEKRGENWRKSLAKTLGKLNQRLATSANGA